MNLIDDLSALVSKYLGPVASYLATLGLGAGTGALSTGSAALLAVVPAVTHLAADAIKDAKAVVAAVDTVAQDVEASK